MHKFKVSGQSVPKVEWKQTDGRTDGQLADIGDCITSHINAVGNNNPCLTLIILNLTINPNPI